MEYSGEDVLCISVVGVEDRSESRGVFDRVFIVVDNSLLDGVDACQVDLRVFSSDGFLDCLNLVV
mgnify:FL=1